MVGSKNPSSDHYKGITPHTHEYVNTENEKSSGEPELFCGKGVGTLTRPRVPGKPGLAPAQARSPWQKRLRKGDKG